jgi:predicted transposase/invertase (TIGR01784 family)
MRNTIRFDWAIKRLLRNKANFGILEGFLSELLGDDIKIENILESESNKQTADNKANRVDLLVQNTKGELIIIEVQSDYMQDYLLRMLFGAAKLVVDNMDAGMLYGKIKKIISVNIVYFDLGHGEDYIYHGATCFTGINKKDILNLSRQEQIVYHTGQIGKIYPEYYIIKVNQFDNIAKNTLDEWVNFLKNEEVKEGSKAKGLTEAKEKLTTLKLTEEERKEYERYIANWRDNESVIVSNYLAGELKGEANKEKYAEEKVKEKEKQTKIEMARKCLAEGMSLAITSRLTGFTEDEIRKLEQE